MDRVILEVCCGSAEDVIESSKAGADRVELCSDLFHGGLTPSIGSLAVARRETDLRIMAMVRPREGGFCYTDTEFEVCRKDASALLNEGADGIVFGFLNEDGTINVDRTEEIASVALASGKDAVFHRAFDVVPDWKEAIDILAELNITRILTSGQEPDVFYGTELIKEMIEYASGRVEIMPGAGITEKNMNRIISETGCRQIHVAAYKTMTDSSVINNRSIFYGGCLYPPEDRFSLADKEYLGRMVRSLV